MRERLFGFVDVALRTMLEEDGTVATVEDHDEDDVLVSRLRSASVPVRVEVVRRRGSVADELNDREAGRETLCRV